MDERIKEMGLSILKVYDVKRDTFMCFFLMKANRKIVKNFVKEMQKIIPNTMGISPYNTVNVARWAK
jgi:hypothetical protein